jgi:hypothetical protein
MSRHDPRSALSAGTNHTCLRCHPTGQYQGHLQTRSGSSGRLGLRRSFDGSNGRTGMTFAAGAPGIRLLAWVLVFSLRLCFS